VSRFVVLSYAVATAPATHVADDANDASDVNVRLLDAR
jgi:hypothetical protein